MTEQVLAVLVEDRRRAIARDLAYARRFRLRRRLAALAFRLAAAVWTVGVTLDGRVGTLEG